MTDQPDPRPEEAVRGRAEPVSDKALDTVFRGARTYRYWRAREVTHALIQATYDLARLGPTSSNCSPGRFVFLTTEESKQRLKPHLDAGNVRQTMAAPVVTIVAYDLAFYERMPDLYPHQPKARSWFETHAEDIFANAFRNGSLQGAYLILAARSLGLDCGPMSGFNNAGVDEDFFAGTNWRSNFLCNIGYGDPSHLCPRSPRLTFDEACQIL